MLGKTPSRYELLSMVRKHSMSLGRGKAEAEEEASEMDAGFWCDIFDLYFLQGKESRGRQDDDLLFFVKKFGARSYGINDSSSGGSPYFVRRWARIKLGINMPTRVERSYRRNDCEFQLVVEPTGEFYEHMLGNGDNLDSVATST